MPSTRTRRPSRPDPIARIWARLTPRLQASVEAGRSLFTVRAAEMARQRLPGAKIRQIYLAQGTARRQGEAERLRLLDLAPGARLMLPLRAGHSCLWLVLGGSAQVAGRDLRRLEAWQGPADAQAEITSAHGARLLVREDSLGGDASQHGSARPQAGAGWQRLAEGLSCWPMGPRGQPGPFLMQMEPGCVVPMHRHGRDEECLMLSGEMYVGDQLLLAGDYQVARAGGVHRWPQFVVDRIDADDEESPSSASSSRCAVTAGRPGA